MSNPDAIPSWGDAVVVPFDLREISKRRPRHAPTVDDLDVMEAGR
jgi:hypothetical protein